MILRSYLHRSIENLPCWFVISIIGWARR